jgi:hypothetical protein
VAASTIYSRSLMPRIALALYLLLAASACAPLRPRTSATPNAPQNQFSWQPARHVPPDGCAVVVAAEKGSESAGEKEGSIDLAPGKPDPKPRDWPPQFQIPQDQVKNFQGRITPRVLKPGSTLFRVIGENGNPAGDYWAILPPPSTEAEWRTEYAVFSWWNGASCVERYVVPKHHPLRVWEGAVGPQPDDGRPGYYLAGGALQYWLPASNSQIDPALIQYAKAPWRH